MFRNKGPRNPHQDGSNGGYPRNRRWVRRHDAQETTIRSEKIAVEHKMFYFILKENLRGRFLRITEESNGKSDTIILPSTGLEDFRSVIDAIIQTSEETPPLQEYEPFTAGDNDGYVNNGYESNDQGDAYPEDEQPQA